VGVRRDGFNANSPHFSKHKRLPIIAKPMYSSGIVVTIRHYILLLNSTTIIVKLPSYITTASASSSQLRSLSRIDWSIHTWFSRSHSLTATVRNETNQGIAVPQAEIW